MRSLRLFLTSLFGVLALMVGLLGTPWATAAPVTGATTPRTTPSATSATTGPGFVPVTPARVLDTRTGTEPAAGSTTTVSISGHAGIPISGVAAVVVNVTAVSPSGPGFVTTYPTGSTRPTASNLNYVKGQIVANQTIVKLGTGGAISLYTQTPTNLVVDVTGYYPIGAQYDALVPSRILDTRPGTEPAAGSTVSLVVTGKGGVPATGVAAVVLNVAAVSPAGPGFVTAYPAGVARPTASVLNYTTDSTVAGTTIAKVGAGGAVNLYTLKAADLVVDVAGWIPARSDFTPITPARILDTRSGVGAPTGPVAAKGTIDVQATGIAGIPANATAVEATVTAVSPAAPGFVTAWPAGVAQPTASTLNYVAGQIVANSATVKLGTTGKLDLYTLAQSDLLIDITGYWTPTSVAWGSAASVDPPQGDPQSISCPTSSFCAAVDTSGNALTWNGTRWTSPQRIDRAGDGLFSVSCPSSSFCAAIDGVGNVLTWNGTAWSAPKAVDTGNVLASVSCPSAGFCAAVDRNGAAVTYNGTSWATPKTIDAAGNGLTSVSCPTSTFCAAVDNNGSTLTYRNGTWSAPAGTDASGGGLTSVSCTSSTFCAAVDWNGNATTYNGTSWATPKSVDPSGGLTSVSCRSMSFCGAVDTNGQALIYRGGGSWSAPTLADTHTGRYGWHAPRSVSCASTAFCTSVDSGGYVATYSSGTWTSSSASAEPSRGGINVVSCPTATFCAAVDANGNALTSSGSAWAKPTQIDPPAESSGSPASGSLTASCASATFCLAVDAVTGGSFTYNGTKWSSSRSTGDSAAIRAVSCPTSTFCAAGDDAGNVLTWSGSSWSAPKSIDAAGNGLTSVSCSSSKFCAAVDRDGNALTFNGSSWSAPKSVDGAGNGLTSVSCPAGTFCAAVDWGGNALTYNGSTWSAPTSIDPTGGHLTSVSCASGSFCAAVDWDGNAASFNGSSWTAPQPVTTAPLVSVSCPTSTHCVAVDDDGNAVTGR
ncbi:hypothetical protein [Flexivirga alba]|uniref:Uncharacterized protein n=1 Tax=Flexivirga alba TaxID=702742 RepID=A0ABW2ADZ0_9MICO